MEKAVTEKLNDFLKDEEIERALSLMNNCDDESQRDIFWARAQVLIEKRKQE